MKLHFFDEFANFPLSLEHDSIQTTEKYLEVEQNLTDAPCDCFRL